MTAREKWHQSTPTLLVALLVVGPLAIPLIWTNKKFPLWLKFAITIMVIVLTVALLSVAKDMTDQMYKTL